MQRETKISSHEYDFVSSLHNIQLHEDLLDRYSLVLSHLADVSKQIKALRQENINLKMANQDLVNHLNVLTMESPPFHSAMELSPTELGLESLINDLKHIGLEEGQSSEKSPTSVIDPDRVQLPKSISVRSAGYLKATRDKGEWAKESNQNKIDVGTQKIYVQGLKKEQPVELEVYNQGMLKTELCNKWQQSGTCPYGENCQFAHGVEELRPVLRHPRYKTEVCRMVLEGIACPYGHRCHFRHSLTEQEKLTRAMNTSSESFEKPRHSQRW